MKPYRNMVLTFALLLTTGCGDRRDELYPLAEDRTWTYQVSTEPEWAATQNTTLTITNMPKRELDGKQVIPQRGEINGQTIFSFVGADAEGVFILGYQQPNSATPELLISKAYLLRHPYAQGTTWQSQSPMLGSAGGDVPTLRTTIEGTEETITVPAGTFADCLRVVARGDQLNGSMGPSTTATEASSWYCPQVGLVKSLSKMGGGGLSVQLESYDAD